MRFGELLDVSRTVIYEDEMSQCRSCGAEIDWVKTKSAKNMPVEGDYIPFDDLKPGEVIITDGGVVYKKQEWQRLPSVKGRISHFAVCPEADAWRRG